jgi:23S rRNA pseudouridine955/2504/2580 synthase
MAEKKEIFVGSRLLQSLEECILFENDDLLVINKPSGLAVHGGSGLDFGLIEALRKLRPDCRRLELAHRLDRDTSGCTIVVKKASVLRFIHAQLRDKTMDKVYLALVKGRWPKRKTHVNQALIKNVLSSGERMVNVSPEGKTSKTAFAIQEVFEGATLLEARPITGRTHQIRVHAQCSGHPLLGDSKYGISDDKEWEKGMGLQRLFLHAYEVTFAVPGQAEKITVKAELPDDLEKVLQNLRSRG